MHHRRLKAAHVGGLFGYTLLLLLELKLSLCLSVLRCCHKLMPVCYCSPFLIMHHHLRIMQQSRWQLPDSPLPSKRQPDLVQCGAALPCSVRVRKMTCKAFVRAQKTGHLERMVLEARAARMRSVSP